MYKRVQERTQWSWLILCLSIPVGAGLLSALFSMEGMRRFETVPQPPFTPPGWVFPVVWTFLYLLMGYAAYVVWRSDAPRRKIDHSLLWFGAQLAANALWSPLFFRWGLYAAAFCWLCVLLALAVVTMLRFGQTDRKAGYLMVPYVLWLLFAGYLNAGVWLLQR